jgi:uncharacterized membrane protein YkvA (DUF1232 family)
MIELSDEREDAALEARSVACPPTRSSIRRLADRSRPMAWWWQTLIGLGAALLVAWLALVTALLAAKPKGVLLGEAVRLLPDLLRLLRRLAADRGLPRGVRIRLGLLMAYLAIPIDVIPDFIPVLGYADDAIVVTLVLRSTVRRCGLAAVRARWPGTDDGFAALCRLTGLNR